MTQRDFEELSALLDGELTPTRAAELRAEIEADPALRAQYDELADIDAGLRTLSAQVSFTPEIALPSSDGRQAEEWPWPVIAGLGVALLFVRFMPKLFNLSLAGVAIQLAVVAAVCVLAVRMSREERLTGVVAF